MVFPYHTPKEGGFLKLKYGNWAQETSKFLRMCAPKPSMKDCVT